MIAGQRVLGIIPARGGSKGVSGKNTRNVAGRPLISWTIEAARKSRFLDRVILSSDDAAIIEVALGLGADVPFVRPADLARDDTPGIDPVLHALQQMPGYHLAVLLQPTSPLRSTEDIDESISLLVRKSAMSCVSVVEAASHPYWTYRVENSGRLVPFIELPLGAAARRQDLPRALAVNGAVYVARVDWLIQKRTFLGSDTVCYEMPASRSLDIDSLQDLEVAEHALRKRGLVESKDC